MCSKCPEAATKWFWIFLCEFLSIKWQSLQKDWDYPPVNTKSLQCLAYPLSAPSFHKLVSAGSMAFDIVNYCDSGPTNCSLSYDSKAKPLFGALKCVVFGHTSDSTLIGSTYICLKQCFYRNPLTKKKHLYNSSQQTGKLLGELNCIC